MINKTNRQTLLFMDNAPCHPSNLPILSVVTRISSLNKTSNLTKAITDLDAIMWTAWESVKDSIIYKSFANVGFHTSLNSLIEQEGIMDDMQYLLQSELSVNQFVDIDTALATDYVFAEEFEKDLVVYMIDEKPQDENKDDVNTY